MRLKWFGTASILLEQDGKKLLFDPFLSLNDKGFKPPAGELAEVSNILVTHGHLDHIADIPAILKRGDGNAAVYCTAAPQRALLAKGVEEAQIHKISPGNILSFGPYEVRVLKGKHVVFNMGLAVKSVLSPRVLFHLNNFRYLLRENRVCVEAGETVIYDILISGIRILLMGSLNLDDNTEYPKDADLLILPFQGRSDICKYAMAFIDRLQPKKVLLDHFDDTFPPISSQVKTEPFMSLMRQKYPNITVICREASAEWFTV